MCAFCIPHIGKIQLLFLYNFFVIAESYKEDVQAMDFMDLGRLHLVFARYLSPRLSSDGHPSDDTYTYVLRCLMALSRVIHDIYAPPGTLLRFGGHV